MSLETDGCQIARGIFTAEEVEWLRVNMPPIEDGAAGSRSLHEVPWMRDFAVSSPMADLAVRSIGPLAKAVRILYFDKRPGSNWKLPYHQDLTITVAQRLDVEGYGPWSVKSEMVHVQPPSAILEQMVAVRLHLDDCPSANGALRVLPGSHRRGKLGAGAVDSLLGDGEIFLEAQSGDVVLMKPLLLHASSPSNSPTHRRVLHIEYAAVDLKPPLEWHLGWPYVPVSEWGASTGFDSGEPCWRR